MGKEDEVDQVQGKVQKNTEGEVVEEVKEDKEAVGEVQEVTPLNKEKQEPVTKDQANISTKNVKKEGVDKMPIIRKRPKKSGDVEKQEQLSLLSLEEEFDDTCFYGTIAHLKMQKKHAEKSKEAIMTRTEFEEKIEEFKKQKIYPEEGGDE